MNKSSLTTGEVAKYCGVNHRTVLRWIKLGFIEAFQLPGRGDNRVPVHECIRFLQSHDIPIPEELARFNEPRRALVVEDDEDMAGYERRLLEKSGFTTQIATDGFQAGTILGTFTPDLLILDLKIPRLNGYQVLKFVRNSPTLAKIKILIVSSSPPEDLNTAIENGANAALRKPFTPAEFNDSIEKLFASPRKRRGRPRKSID